MPPATPTSAEARPEEGSAEAGASNSLDDQLALTGDEQLQASFPSLGKPRKILAAARQAGLLLPLLKQVLLQEEVKRTGGSLDALAEWRRSRWQSRVQQTFINQRRRFERASFYQLNLPEKGLAMELYYQLCNGEVTFDQLLATYMLVKPGKKQMGIMRQKSLEKFPRPLAKKLRRSEPGQPIAPLTIGRVVTLMQLIEWHEPVLDEATHLLLQAEVEDQWLLDELHRRMDSPTGSSTFPAAPPDPSLPPGTLVNA